MTANPLVSIIIPTYNRAHLIGETLDSVLAQTYTNWECIVVDDGSTDATGKLMKKYCNKDTRFQYHKRPNDRPKGANACRNHGFELSKGDYVNWFDSDDIMLPEKLLSQLRVLLKNPSVDYCIDRHDNFIEPKTYRKESTFLNNQKNEVDLNNYLFHKVFWITINFLGKRTILVNSTFDETLQSGQEYNFFVALLANNTTLKGEFLNKVLNYHRVHKQSIQQAQKQNKLLRLHNKFAIYWNTFNSYKAKLSMDNRLFLLKNACTNYQKLLLKGEKKVPIYIIVKEVNSVVGIFSAIKIGVIMWISFYTKKGDSMGNKMINRILI